MLHEFDACMRASRKHSIVVSIKDADRGAAPAAHGRGRGRRRPRAARAPHLLGHPVHREPAAPGALRHGAGLRARPGRHPHDALSHAHPGGHGAGHAGRHGGRQQHRDPRRAHRHPARLPRGPAGARRRPHGPVHAHRRLLRQRARSAAAARRAGPDGGLLRPARGSGLGRHQGQAARRPGGLREHARPAAGAGRRRRLPVRRRACWTASRR